MSEQSAEARAEELMERLASEGSRRLNLFLGRAREEIEDIIAEARSLNYARTARPDRSTGSSSRRSATPAQR